MVIGLGSQPFPSYDQGAMSPGVGTDPRTHAGYMVVFVSSCPVNVYMVIGWGSQPFASYDPGAMSPGVGTDPGTHAGCMVVFVSSCPVSVYMVIGWGSQPFPSYDPWALLPRPWGMNHGCYLKTRFICYVFLYQQ